jgi:uncharacterized DUF497 family protein
MRFEWDENKRRANISRHGFDFVDIPRVFEDPICSFIDDRFDYGEVRYFTLGLLFGRIVAISHTETDEIRRIISVRKANKNEQERYFTEIANRLDEN